MRPIPNPQGWEWHEAGDDGGLPVGSMYSVPLELLKPQCLLSIAPFLVRPETPSTFTPLGASWTHLPIDLTRAWSQNNSAVTARTPQFCLAGWGHGGWRKCPALGGLRGLAAAAEFPVETDRG